MLRSDALAPRMYNRHQANPKTIVHIPLRVAGALPGTLYARFNPNVSLIHTLLISYKKRCLLVGWIPQCESLWTRFWLCAVICVRWRDVASLSIMLEVSLTWECGSSVVDCSAGSIGASFKWKFSVANNYIYIKSVLLMISIIAIFLKTLLICHNAW